MISNEKEREKVNLVNSKQIVIPEITDHPKKNNHKNDELKKAIKMALALRTKVDENELAENKNCLCGGHFLKGIYNFKDIIVCDTCHRAKFFKVSDLKKGNFRKDLSLSKNNEPKKIFFNLSNLENKNIEKNNSVYRKPVVKLGFDLSKSMSKDKSQFEKLEKKRGNLLNSVQDLTFRTLLKNYYTNTIGSQKEISKNDDEINNNSNSNYKNNYNSNNNNNIVLSSDLNMNEYKMLKLIGNGSYANIYLVENYKTKTLYAAKKLIIDGENELEKIKLEISIIKTLSELDPENKYFVPVYQYSFKKLDLTSYSVYLLMPLAKSDWGKQIENKSIFYNEETLLNILKNCSYALKLMQYKNIAHRDIKPQNILLMENGNYLFCDFDESIFVKKAYGSYDIRGTEMFMSPILENSMFSGNKKTKFNIYKSDVYSLGLCFVYAITKNLDVLKKIKRCNDDNLNRNLILNNIEGDENYSKQFIDIIMQMIAYNEKDRLDCIQLDLLVNKQQNNI